MTDAFLIIACDRQDVFFSIPQMSKSTGNFLALSEAISKFSADGEHFV